MAGEMVWNTVFKMNVESWDGMWDNMGKVWRD